jgi:hypothetical protein
VVWAIFTLAAVGFVTIVGTNAPYADEWEFVPVLVGEEPALPWLWQQHNEHRIPLPRLIYLVLFKLTHDFRSGMLAQVVVLSALALYLMRQAGRLRGRPHWADAFFPVSLLHVGHWENFVMGYQICFALFAALATGLVVVALRATTASAFRSGVTAGVLLMLLALTGGSGLAVVVPVSAWILYLAVRVWRGASKGRSLVLALCAVLPLVYLGAYFVDYHKPEGHPEPSSDPIKVGRVVGQVLGVSFGMGLSGVWWIVFPALVVLGGWTVALLLGRWKTQPEERPGVVGLVAVAAGVTGVAVAIGIGRGGWDDGMELSRGMGLWSRYSLLTWPLLGATYLVWVKAGRKWVPIVLCVAAALAFPGNMGVGMWQGGKVKAEYSAIEADAATGLSAEQIVDGEDRRLKQFPETTAIVLQKVDGRSVRGIPMLRKARIGIFAR